MWWGVAIEAPDPGALARFYAELLGWPVVHEEPGTAVVGAPPAGSSFLVFQLAEGYEPPVWPPVDGRQRPMAHLDFQVADLDGSAARAVALGARESEFQSRPQVRVMLDPAGHPFCLCLDD
ncbi:catechol 2,3-dioxygenase-like lactoylglutathione lyase family enzyme [Allocatelliglobosispora scoriae]|uniref:Catechol 2,3-dioxygenase-like lactoylglutathione lyase family enzyme n=1 Tax=Allocatelliglobosispora scoriae TaxID=643052 RepID=A0A841C3X0_9ACTN|nr:VOC family protein [Allocatelliglobosispora scoriae]MBB5873660.1 catechol 2,3-dioxygenase-like lactoylglutathione lyase family enzyme [Allocatelliglobosispora scoriae]